MSDVGVPITIRVHEEVADLMDAIVAASGERKRVTGSDALWVATPFVEATASGLWAKVHVWMPGMVVPAVFDLLELAAFMRAILEAAEEATRVAKGEGGWWQSKKEGLR